MTCDKCTDIHGAQREGKTTKECECKCHNETIKFPTNPYWHTWPTNIIPFDGTNVTMTCNTTETK